MNSKQALPAATNACRLRMDNTIPDQTDNGNDSGVGSASCSPTIEHISGANVTYGSPTSRITGFNLNAVMSSPVQQNESQSMRFETPPSSISPVSVPMSSPDSEINGNQADLDNKDALARLQSLRGNDYLYGNTSPNDMANRNKGRQNRVPTVNSHGKIKIYKCKQCAFKATTKNEYWIHCNIHIDPEKRLECPKCIFVTEYKHHLEYHMANHSGLKPFKCLQCKYTCVSKSMLTSHLKSHSKVHQFNCKDCGYSTKYIHSLKTHLRKLKHKRVLILNPDGTPNPNMVVDVNGSRRGPRTKRPAQSPPTQPTAPGPEAIMQHSFNQLMMATAPLRYSLYPLFNPIPAAAIANTLLLQNLERLTTNETCNETLNETRNDSLMEYEVLDLSTSNRNRNQPSTARLEEDTDGEVVQVQSTQTKYYQYHCQYCEMTFGNATMHAMHMRFHGSSRYPFTCSMCGVINKDAITFFNHIAQQQHL